MNLPAMNLRTLTTPLLAATLLLSTFGCSKKEEATPVAMGSYKLDGATKSCQVKAYVSSATSGGLAYDYLEVDLATTPQPASGAEILKLYYVKPSGQPTNAYIMNAIELSVNNSLYSFGNNASTLNSTISGGFSGTFSATASRTTSPPPYSYITDGVYTDVRP
jgi:hypothetical protein